MTDSPWLVAKLQVALKLKPYLRMITRQTSQLLGNLGPGRSGRGLPTGGLQERGNAPFLHSKKERFFPRGQRIDKITFWPWEREVPARVGKGVTLRDIFLLCWGLGQREVVIAS